MRNELTETLTNIKDIELIRKLISNMDNKDIFKLISLLEYTDKETQDRWINTYNQTMKGEI
jgi:hypothetical protein